MLLPLNWKPLSTAQLALDSIFAAMAMASSSLPSTKPWPGFAGTPARVVFTLPGAAQCPRVGASSGLVVVDERLLPFFRYLLIVDDNRAFWLCKCSGTISGSGTYVALMGTGAKFTVGTHALKLTLMAVGSPPYTCMINLVFKYQYGKSMKRGRKECEEGDECKEC
jgi:hypothetical protein